MAVLNAEMRTELPPRTRRIQRFENLVMTPVGTTSAHAENTRGYC